jgi:hypothetical protein
LAVHLEDGGIVEPGKLGMNVYACPNGVTQATRSTKR